MSERILYVRRAVATDADTTSAHRPSRRTLYLVLAPIVVLTALAYVGDILAAGLVQRHPLWLMLLSTRKRYLALAVPHTTALSYFGVGLFRQLLAKPLWFVLGRWYGDAGVRWLERKLGEGGSFVRLLERGYAKATWPVVALFPNALVCMLAGASGMPVSVFGGLTVVGTVATLVVVRIFGDVFSGPLNAVTHFLDRYRWPLIALSAVAVLVSVLTQRKKGTSELESPAALERELNEATESDSGGNSPD